MKKITATLILLMVTMSLSAQLDLSKWSLGLYPGIVQYHNTDGSELFKLKESSLAIDLGVGYDLNSSFTIEGHFMGTNLDHFPTDTSVKTLDTDVFDLNAQLLYRFNNGYILKEDACVSPFLFAGIGGVRSKEGFGAVIPLGVGINFRIDEYLSLQWRTAYKLTTLEEYNYFQHMVGFVLHLGSKGEPEVVEEGPKDSDNDGVVDAMDKCPNVPGIQSNGGCPELDAETKDVLNAAIKGIQFETSKDVLKAESYPVLDRVVSVMTKHPEYNLSIDGYTDSSGNDDMNLDLSKRRAKTALNYLVNKGIAADRLSSAGYGEAKPIADNKTAEGRAKNRRVEFKIIF